MAGMDCPDVGSMEGLMPAMMRRKGAARVLDTDAIPHCERKIAAPKEAYSVRFDFRRVDVRPASNHRIKRGVCTYLRAHARLKP